jgi:hypothetical protein
MAFGLILRQVHGDPRVAGVTYLNAEIGCDT